MVVFRAMKPRITVAARSSRTNGGRGATILSYGRAQYVYDVCGFHGGVLKFPTF